MLRSFEPEHHAQANCWIDFGGYGDAGLLPASAQSAQVLTSAQIVEVFVGKTIKQVDDRYWAFTNQVANWAVFTLMTKTKAVGVFLVTDCANDGSLA